MRYKSFLILSVLVAGVLGGCQEKSPEQIEQGMVLAKMAETETESRYDPDTQALVNAITQTSKLSSFAMSSDIQLNLDGSLINIAAKIHSDADIIQGNDRDDLQMSMVTTSNLDDKPAYAYYKDGIYYTEDAKGKQKEEKTPEEVMKAVTDITELVLDAADKIENLEVSQNGSETVYMYSIPGYLAEQYLQELAEGAEAQETPLAGAESDVGVVQMISHVSEDGLLNCQEATMDGTLKKSVFKVPADANIKAEFTPTEKTDLDIPIW